MIRVIFMYESKIETEIGNFVSDVNVYHFSDSITIQFSCEWDVDRVSDHIQSAICIDDHGLVEEINLRPGHLFQTSFGYDDAIDFIESVLQTVGGDISNTSNVKITDYNNSLWRVHVQNEEQYTFDEVLSWISNFLKEYHTSYNKKKDNGLQMYPFLPGYEMSDNICFQCNDNLANLVCTAVVTENETLNLLVCDECVDTVVSFPFVKPVVKMDMMNGTPTVSTGDGFVRLGKMMP